MSQEAPSPSGRITFSPLEGCTLKAVSLAGNIRRCFEIPVKVVQTNDGFFEVTINGVSIYRKKAYATPVRVMKRSSWHLQGTRSPCGTFPRPPDEDLEQDPRHRAWLRAMLLRVNKGRLDEQNNGKID